MHFEHPDRATSRLRRRERRWRDRNPVWDRFIPDFNSPSAEGRAGQLESFVRRPTSPEYDLGVPDPNSLRRWNNGPTSPLPQIHSFPKTPQLLFSNSVSWARSKFPPESAFAAPMEASPTQRPHRFRFNRKDHLPVMEIEPSKLARFDTEARPPTVSHARGRRSHTPAALFPPPRESWNVRIGTGVPTAI